MQQPGEAYSDDEANLQSIAAVVVGGTSLSGGEGSILGMVIGAFIVGFLGNGLNLLGIQSFYQSVFKGLVLVSAVILDIALKNKLKST
jgi:ribose/xylose/arabinose/galactoside ABC-type transport system permease subunit